MEILNLCKGDFNVWDEHTSIILQHQNCKHLVAGSAIRAIVSSRCLGDHRIDMQERRREHIWQQLKSKGERGRNQPGEGEVRYLLKWVFNLQQKLQSLCLDPRGKLWKSWFICWSYVCCACTVNARQDGEDGRCVALLRVWGGKWKLCVCGGVFHLLLGSYMFSIS